MCMWCVCVCVCVCCSDEGVCFPIQKGLVASRSKVKYFRHNDMDHLAQLLQEQHLLEKKVKGGLVMQVDALKLYSSLSQNPAKAKVTRKFIVAEAIYYNWGDVAPLPEMVRHCVRCIYEGQVTRILTAVSFELTLFSSSICS